MAEKAADPCTACLAIIEQDGPDLYIWPSRPAGSALMADMKVLGVPSGLCWRHMASNADLEAVTHASRGPYRFRTCRDMLSVGDLLTEEQYCCYRACPKLTSCHLRWHTLLQKAR